ncbi:hypothetical protein DIURU_003910 [Diutina rugosa]|uniref:Uncharacterized protein n=1 Tax=Diutina rugosa TaxID=5481 RepID=A0A642UJB1_DIURU|nr:uncharacterized protein DIURU_003910 [Diutina rugosa]KAA8900094.1 hypothetical protein DIURU_003910 [Diutina rugosa]
METTQPETTNGVDTTIKQESEQPVETNGVEVKQETSETSVSEPAPAAAPTPVTTTNKGKPVTEEVGGSSVRRYLNQHLTVHLLEGLKLTSQTKPEDPLKFLGEFLIQRSNELAMKEDNN